MSSQSWKTCQGLQDHCPHCGAEAGSPQVARNGTSQNYGRVYQVCTVQPNVHLWWANVNVPAMTQAPTYTPAPQGFHEVPQRYQQELHPSTSQYHHQPYQPYTPGEGATIPASQAPKIPCSCGANANAKCATRSCQSCCRKEAILRRNSEICTCQSHRGANRQAIVGMVVPQQVPTTQETQVASQNPAVIVVHPPAQPNPATSHPNAGAPATKPIQNALEPTILNADTSPRLQTLYNRAPSSAPAASRPKQMKITRAFKLIFLVEDGEDEIFDLSIKEGRAGGFKLEDYPRERRVIATEELRIWNPSAQHWERLFVDDEKAVREGDEVFIRPTKMSLETAERLRKGYLNQRQPGGPESYRRNGITVIAPLPAISQQPLAPLKGAKKSSSKASSRSQSAAAIPPPPPPTARKLPEAKGQTQRKVARSNTGKWPAREHFVVVDDGFTKLRRSRLKGDEFFSKFLAIFGPVAKRTCAYRHYRTWGLAGTITRNEWRLAHDGLWVEFAAIAGTGGQLSETEEDNNSSEDEDKEVEVEVLELSDDESGTADDEDEVERNRQIGTVKGLVGAGRGRFQRKKYLVKDSDEESVHSDAGRGRRLDREAERGRSTEVVRGPVGGKRGKIPKKKYVVKDSDEESMRSDGGRGRRLNRDLQCVVSLARTPPAGSTLASLKDYVEDDGKSFMKMLGMRWGSEDEAEAEDSDVEMAESTPKRPPVAKSGSISQTIHTSPSNHSHTSKRLRTNDNSAFQTLLSTSEPRNRRVSGSSASSSTSEGPSASVYESLSERDEKEVTSKGEDEDELEDDDDYEYGGVGLILGAF